MRSTSLGISIFTAVFGLSLVCVSSQPAFASGDDKPAAPAATGSLSATPPSAPSSSSTAPSAKPVRPDREKKVYTNDDIDRMWPKAAAATGGAQTLPASAFTPPSVVRPVTRSGATGTANVPATAETNPVWYAAQIESLSAELEQISSKEQSLREFRATGASPDVTVGLQFNAPCEGITTDNEIAQLGIRRQEIEQQMNELQDTAQQNGISPAVFQSAPEILQAAQKPLSPGQQRASIQERQSELLGKLDGVQNQLADMSSQAAAQGIVLLPVTPNWGGNLTTNLIQGLDSRAGAIQNALRENEDAARQAGIAPSALP